MDITDCKLSGLLPSWFLANDSRNSACVRKVFSATSLENMARSAMSSLRLPMAVRKTRLDRREKF